MFEINEIMPWIHFLNESMNEGVWDDTAHGMLSNGNGQTEMNTVPSVRHGGARSQDDAMVGYFFQRPQSDPDFQTYNKNSRWALGDDSVLEVRGNETADIEAGFRALALETNLPLEQMAMSTTKKLWDEDNTSKGNEHKPIFMGEQWRESAWNPVPNASSVSQPIMVQRRSGSFPGSDANNMLSPRSSEAGGLGVKMVEYVLGSSPTTKDMDRLGRLHVMNPNEADKVKKGVDSKEEVNGGVMQANGILQNGLDDEQAYNRQPTPIEDDLAKSVVVMNEVGKMTKHPNDVAPVPMAPGGPSLSLDGGFESVNIDSLHFEYGSQMIPNMDSPGMMDFGSQMYQQQQRNQAQQHMMNQQQYTQQPPNAGPTYTSNPYILNQDPYGGAVGPLVAAGPTMMPQYYGVTPWMMPPAGMMQGGNQGQGQLMRGGGARPMTPQGSSGDGMNQGHGPSNMQGPGGQYPILHTPFYDQNGSLMMGGNRGLSAGQQMRVMPPPVLLNPGSSGNPARLIDNLGSGSLRLLSSQGQTPQGSLFSNNGSSSALYTSATNSPSLNYNPSYSTNNAAYGPSGMGMNQGYGSNAFGPIGQTSTIGSLGSPRRDSFDRRDTSGLGNPFSSGLDPQFNRPKANQFYSPLGNLSSASSRGAIGMLTPGPSITPPPTLNGTSTSLNIGNLGSRLSAAPGAESKFMARNGNSSFGSTNPIFQSRQIQRNCPISSEKSGGRSRLLEDFRNNRFPNLQLRELTNHIVEFSQDQHGSRFIQQKLERACGNEKTMVFNEIIGHAYNLMTDVFGNYVIQKFFEFGTQDQKSALAQRLKGHVLPLALQMYGCRVIQKALESIPAEQQEIVKELEGHVLKCVKDQNGNHVVQKCIECVEPAALQFLIKAFHGQVLGLSTHPYGCRVIQRILEHCTSEQTAPILEELHNHTEQLVQDQYGNYVIQHVLEHGLIDDKSKIVKHVRGKVLSYSQHKFASNVVEKCVTHGLRNERTFLIDEVVNFTDGPHSALYSMMRDQYANYVVQKMIEVAEVSQRKMLVHKIRPHISQLRKFTYGKHILSKLEKYLMKGNEMGGHLGP